MQARLQERQPSLLHTQPYISPAAVFQKHKQFHAGTEGWGLEEWLWFLHTASVCKGARIKLGWGFWGGVFSGDHTTTCSKVCLSAQALLSSPAFISSILILWKKTLPRCKPMGKAPLGKLSRWKLCKCCTFLEPAPQILGSNGPLALKDGKAGINVTSSATTRQSQVI